MPNFSEGQDTQTIEMIADACRSVPGCTLLDVDPGFSTNRTVYTFVGNPDAVVEGAMAMAEVATYSTCGRCAVPLLLVHAQEVPTG